VTALTVVGGAGRALAAGAVRQGQVRPAPLRGAGVRAGSGPHRAGLRGTRTSRSCSASSQDGWPSRPRARGPDPWLRAAPPASPAGQWQPSWFPPPGGAGAL